MRKLAGIAFAAGLGMSTAAYAFTLYDANSHVVGQVAGTSPNGGVWIVQNFGSVGSKSPQLLEVGHNGLIDNAEFFFPFPDCQGQRWIAFDPNSQIMPQTQWDGHDLYNAGVGQTILTGVQSKETKDGCTYLGGINMWVTPAGFVGPISLGTAPFTIR